MKRTLISILIALVPTLALAQITVSPGGSGGGAGDTTAAGTNDFTGANSFLDGANFSLKNTATPTKILRFDLSGLVGTRTATVPNLATIALCAAGADCASTVGQTSSGGFSVTGTGISTYAVGASISMLGGSATVYGPYDGTANTISYRSQFTPDSAIMSTGTTGNSWHVAEAADAGFDFNNCSAGTSAATDPLFCVHSRNQSTTQWIDFKHDGTNGVISVGAGTLTLGPTTSLTAPDNSSGAITSAINAGTNTIFSDSAHQTATGLLVGTNTNNYVLIAEKADVYTGQFNFAHPAQTNPTLFGHSAAQSTTQWWSHTHDGTNAVIGVGLGALKVSAASGLIISTGSAPTVSACGSTPSAVTGSNTAGRLTTGSGGAVQSCTLTFVPALAAAPACVVNDESSILLVRAVATTTTLTLDAAVAGPLASQILTYHCFGGV